MSIFVSFCYKLPELQTDFILFNYQPLVIVFILVGRQDSHKTCPICRAVVNSSKESWVLSEKPDDVEVAHDATSYVMGLINSQPNDSDSSDVE